MWPSLQDQMSICEAEQHSTLLQNAFYILFFFFKSQWILTFLAWVSPGSEPETQAGKQEVYLGSSPREWPWRVVEEGSREGQPI